MKPFLTIKQIQEKLKNKEVCKDDILSFYKKRIEKYNPKLNAIVETFENKNSDENTNGALDGIPGLLKDNICQKGYTTSCASKILSNFKSTYDATVTKRLKDEGATIIGRTNMDEFAMGSSGEFSAYGPTKNPWDLTRVPGGSSSGSAAAVAAGLAPWALGTETGGSVRQPASFCGLVGLYPTYGQFSRNGIVAFASSTDQPAPLTKTVYDNAIVASVLSGHDPKDGTSVPSPKIDYTKNLNGKMPKDLTIGVIRDSIESDGVDSQIKEKFENSVAHLQKLGAKIKYVDLPALKYGNAVYFIISRAEAASNLSRYDGVLYGNRSKEAKNIQELYIQTRQNGFGEEVKRRVLMGNYVLSSAHKDAYYNKAMEVRSIIQSEFNQAFKDVDTLLCPTTTTMPFKLGKEVSDPLAMYMADYFNVPMCIAGIPALSITCGFSKENLPIGFQFVGPRLSEKLLYQVAYAYEQSTDYHLKHPTLD